MFVLESSKKSYVPIFKFSFNKIVGKYETYFNKNFYRKNVE